MIKNRFKSYYSLSIRLDLFVKLKYEESSTIILFVGISYSMRDLLSDLNMPDPQTTDMRQIR